MNIKKLIFDIDGTLIKWESRYTNTIQNALDKLNIAYTEELCSNIWNAQFDYEDKIGFYDETNLLNYINSNLNLKLPHEFISIYKTNIEDCVPKSLDKNIVKTLDYLSSKYELVVLTNWFANNQIERLKKINLLQYFSKVFGGEKYCKPQKNSFIQTFDGLTACECAMIGDNLEKDILGAKNAGIKNLFWINSSNKNYNINIPDITVINSIVELQDLL